MLRVRSATDATQDGPAPKRRCLGAPAIPSTPAEAEADTAVNSITERAQRLRHTWLASQPATAVVQAAPLAKAVATERRDVAKMPRAWAKLYTADELALSATAASMAHLPWAVVALWVDESCSIDFVSFMCRRLPPRCTVWVPALSSWYRRLRTRLYRDQWDGHWREGPNDVDAYEAHLAAAGTVHVHCWASHATAQAPTLQAYVAHVPDAAVLYVWDEAALAETLTPAAPGWLSVASPSERQNGWSGMDVAAVWSAPHWTYRHKGTSHINQVMKRILAKVDLAAPTWVQLTTPEDVWQTVRKGWGAWDPQATYCRHCLRVRAAGAEPCGHCTFPLPSAATTRQCPKCDRPMEGLEYDRHPEHLCHVCCLLDLPGGISAADMTTHIMSIVALQWFRMVLQNPDVARALLVKSHGVQQRDPRTYTWEPREHRVGEVMLHRESGEPLALPWRMWGPCRACDMWVVTRVAPRVHLCRTTSCQTYWHKCQQADDLELFGIEPDGNDASAAPNVGQDLEPYAIRWRRAQAAVAAAQARVTVQRRRHTVLTSPVRSKWEAQQTAIPSAAMRYGQQHAGSRSRKQQSLTVVDTVVRSRQAAASQA